MAADAGALANRVADKLLAGQISTPLRSEIVNLVSRYSAARAVESRGAGRLLRRHFARVRVAAVKERNPMPTDPQSRRDFLRVAGTSAAGFLLARPHDAIGQMLGGSAPFADYRALVCVFLFGGNDSFNMLVPRSPAEYNAYAASRQNLAIAADQLLPINPLVSDGAQYGVHPSMAGVKDLFDRGQAAFVANVGPLLAPTTKSQYQAKSVPLPPQLFSHNDQQDQWHGAARPQPHGNGMGGPHGRSHSFERREPAARDERLAGRQHVVSVRGRHGRVHDGRDGPAGVLGLRRDGFQISSSAARSSASSTRATTRCMRAVSPRCSGVPSRPPTV